MSYFLQNLACLARGGVGWGRGGYHPLTDSSDGFIFFLKLKKYYFMHVGVLLICISVHGVHA